MHDRKAGVEAPAFAYFPDGTYQGHMDQGFAADLGLVSRHQYRHEITLTQAVYLGRSEALFGRVRQCHTPHRTMRAWKRSPRTCSPWPQGAR